MPIMNGFDAARAIRASRKPDAKTVPIIAITANAFAEDAEKCLACGMNAHLPKPLDSTKMTALIAEFCRNAHVNLSHSEVHAPV